MKRFLPLICVLILLFSCEKQQVVTSGPPNSAFTTSIQPSLPVTVQFTSPTASNYASFVWNFGDGGFSFLASPTNIYTSFGDFNVILLQESSTGIRDTTFRTVNTSIAGPSTPTSTSIFNYFVSMGAPIAVKFTNQSVNANSYLWVFGDGATSTSGADTLTHIYSQNGIYSVKLITTGDGGIDSSATTLNL